MENGKRPVREEGMSDEEWEELLHEELFREYERESRRYASRLRGREETEADEAGAPGASNGEAHSAPGPEETEGIGDLPEGLFGPGGHPDYSGGEEDCESCGAWGDDPYGAEEADVPEEREDDTF